MAQHPGLMQTILDDPDDDGARLVYADWLDENGDPARADLIRVQVRLAQLDEFDAERPDLEVRERALLSDHQTHWLAEFPGLKGRSPKFARGFIAGLECSEVDWVRRAKGLHARIPLQDVSLSWHSHSTADILAAPTTSRLRRLALQSSSPKRADLTHLFRCSALADLRYLKPWSCAYGAHALAAEVLLDAPHLPGLRALHLDRTNQGDFLARMITGSPLLAQLEGLNLWYNEISAAGIRELAGAAAPRLTRLEVGGNDLGTDGAKHLAAWGAVGQLQELDLSYTRSGTEGLLAFVASGRLRSVRKLDLSRNDIGPEGARALATCPGLEGLRSLSLSHNPLGAAGVEALAGAPFLRSLRKLALWDAGPDEAVATLLRSPQLTQPWSLAVDVGRNCSHTLRALAEAPWLDGLTLLNLRGSRSYIERRQGASVGDQFRLQLDQL